MHDLKCKTCGNAYHWSHAFAKFGFDDGNGSIGTHDVSSALEKAGYSVRYARWNLHNIIIFSIQKDGIEYIPRDNSNYRIGYDDPKKYLPVEILSLLDTAFPVGRIFY